MLKYTRTAETKDVNGVVLHRIVALRSFGNVTQGDLGGWIEKESNLSHNGDAWVYGDAMVFEYARVYGDARVYGSAMVYGSAKVDGDATVLGSARVYGSAKVDGDGYFYLHIGYQVTYDGHGWLSIGCQGMSVEEWKAEWQSMAEKQGPDALEFAKKYKKIIVALINAQKGGVS